MSLIIFIPTAITISSMLLFRTLIHRTRLSDVIAMKTNDAKH